MASLYKTFIFFLVSIIVLFSSSCSSTKRFTHTFKNPLDFAYDRILLKDRVLIDSIKTYKLIIDSIINKDENQKLVIRHIIEGTLKQQIVIGNSNNRETTKETKFGGFGEYTYTNLKGDTVFSIMYHDNIEKNFYERYYYKNNKLVFALIELQEDGIGQSFYKREENYSGDKLLLVKESKNEIGKEYKQRINFDLRKKGDEYLKTYLSKKE